MSGMFRLPDEAALREMLKRSHVRVVSPLGFSEEKKPGSPAAAKPIAKSPEIPVFVKEPKPAPVGRGAKKGAPDYESVLCRQIARAGLPMPVRQFRLDEKRRWRIDLAWPDRKIAVEVDGMAHRIRERFMRDIERQNELAFRGWKLYRVYTRWITSESRESDKGISIVKRALA